MEHKITHSSLDIPPEHAAAAPAAYHRVAEEVLDPYCYGDTVEERLDWLRQFAELDDLGDGGLYIVVNEVNSDCEDILNAMAPFLPEGSWVEDEARSEIGPDELPYADRWVLYGGKFWERPYFGIDHERLGLPLGKHPPAEIIAQCLRENITKDLEQYESFKANSDEWSDALQVFLDRVSSVHTNHALLDVEILPLASHNESLYAYLKTRSR